MIFKPLLIHKIAAGILIPLWTRDGTIRAYAIVDECDAHLARQRWRLHSAGYAKGRVGGNDVFLHRAVLGLVPGDGLEGDHKDGNKLDCRRSNLRVGTHALNQQNSGPRAGVTSAYRGVSWQRAKSKWQAHASVNGRTVYLGIYEDEAAAAEAAKAFRLAKMPFTNEERGA